ncbi:MAG: ABC transporter ATP-binding protein/permease [Novosphingobium sp.]|nr:ABC transporter ATP-binding protein/permease [Novosphingobium sp.]
MPPDAPSRPDRTPADWRTVKRFLPYLWQSGRKGVRTRLAMALLLILLSKLTVFSMPYAMRSLTNDMAGPSSQPVMWAAIWLVVAYTAARFTTVLFDNIRNVVFERVGQTSVQMLAEDVFVRLHRLSLRFHLARRTGEVTKIIERGTKSINNMLYFLLFNIAPTVLELGISTAIFYSNFGWGLVAVTLASVIAYIVVTTKITEWRAALRLRMNELDGQALGRAVDSLLNYETVKYFGAEAREHARYSQAAESYMNAAVKSENSLALLNVLQAVITNLLMGGAMAYTVWEWSRGHLRVGDLVFVNMLLMQLFRPLDFLGMVYRTIRQGLIDMAQMFALIDTEVEVRDAPGAPALIVNEPTVVFDNVVFGYDKERTILHGLSLEVPAGRSVAIVGPSGAGKSTIGRLLFRFYDPWEGRILIAGQDISQVTQESLRSVIGIVPQDSVLFNDTIGYNIAYGRGDADMGDVTAAARGAAILPFIERLPAGFDTQVGERGLKLSGGEKQRVAIARTLVKNPPILLLDEATSALDTRTEQEILATLRRISEDRTTISIAHRLSTIADSDLIYVMQEGRLAEQGTHLELLRHDGLYAEMWARQLIEGEELDAAAE